MQKCPAPETNFASETLCHRKRFLVSGRHFLWQDGEISSHRTKSQGEISSHRKNFEVTEKNILSQEEISCCTKIFHITGQSFLLQQIVFCHMKKLHLKGQNFMWYLNLKCWKSRIHSLIVGCQNSYSLERSFREEKNLARKWKIVSHPAWIFPQKWRQPQKSVQDFQKNIKNSIFQSLFSLA